MAKGLTGKGRPPSRTQRAGSVSKQSAHSSDPGSQYSVMWLPQAEKELTAIKDSQEQAAILQVAQVLAANGPQLRFPHQSAAQGKQGKGLRELRPRRGRSRWRPLYRRVASDIYVILAVGPEAKIDPPGFDAATKKARQRLDALTDQ